MRRDDADRLAIGRIIPHRHRLMRVVKILTEFLPWLALGAIVWTAACLCPADLWAPPRLASAYALAAGLDLYPPLDSGAQLCWLYGPVFPLWLLPVTLLPSLTWAMVVALLWQAAALVSALAWAFRPLSAHWREAWFRAAGTALLLAGTYCFGGWLTRLHVDTCGLAFLALSVGAVERHERGGGIRWLHLAAAAGILAAGTKQLAALYPCMLTIYWLALGHWRKAGLWLGLTCAYGLAALLIFAARFGLANPWFYLVTIHRLLPAVSPWAYLTAWRWTLLTDLLPWAALAGLSRILAGARSDERSSPRLYWWLGFSQLPLGVYAATKSGGGLNSAYGMLFLAMAVSLGLGRVRNAAWQAALTLGLCLLALGANQGNLATWRPQPDQDELLTMARRHPGRLYLPQNPLITIMTDRKIYPFDYALQARELTGTALTPAQIRAAIPTNPLILSGEIRHFLPQARTLTLPALRAMDERQETDRWVSWSYPE